ncbi:class II fructose-bisphosphate aldolase [Tetragenococcus solitarius]|uniref:Class II fructose-bisphosphate aldolase n=1 Tax=Tetragenococcus solitarius TaxID=71453 RepID=A0ABN3Y433_9ENTE|nr:class II fructose-bisphosphate aldolase [Tetragenococcus solitarius]
MLVHSKKILLEAKKENFAVPATNFIDLDSARSYVTVAEKRGLPLILAYAQSHSEILSIEEAALIGKFLAEKSKVPIVLHLDHGEDTDFIYKAIDLGFRSVMIDASREDFHDNIALTKKVVDYAHQLDVTVEAELGHVGSNDFSELPSVTDSIYTEVEDVLEFVEQTEVDSLAISIGTAHGIYQGAPEINFDRLKEIDERTEIPLVLHGGSSSGDANLYYCATHGISKVNIFSDFINDAFSAIHTQQPQDYLALKNIANQTMEKVLDHYYDVFATQPIYI